MPQPESDLTNNIYGTIQSSRGTATPPQHPSSSENRPAAPKQVWTQESTQASELDQSKTREKLSAPKSVPNIQNTYGALPHIDPSNISVTTQPPARGRSSSKSTLEEDEGRLTFVTLKQRPATPMPQRHITGQNSLVYPRKTKPTTQTQQSQQHKPITGQNSPVYPRS